MESRDWDRRWEEREEPRSEPSRFLVACAEGMRPGRALDLACGAGRNAVWLAERGWRVTAVDFSEVGLAKARVRAAERGVEVEWVRADLLEYAPPAGTFDLVLVLYLQLPAAELRVVLASAASAVAPDGALLVVGHHVDNLTQGWGGPKSADVLYTAGDVVSELSGLAIDRAERVVRTVEEEDGVHEAIDALVLATRPPA